MRINSNRGRIGICFFVAAALALMSAVSVQAKGPGWIGAFYVNGKVGLKWKAVDGAEKYGVYRKVADGEYASITTVEKTQYFDTEITGGSEYTYKIAAISAEGTETFGGEKSVTVPGMKAGAFVPPIWSGARVDRDKIFLNWDRISGVMAYNVYRSETSGGGFEVIGNATGTRYADQDGLVKGKTYYYVVTALNEEFEETEYSEEQEMKFGLSAEEKAELAKGPQIELEELARTLDLTIEAAGGSAGKLNQPAAIWVDGSGTIYATDPMNGRVVVFDAAGKYVKEIGQKCPQGMEENPPAGAMVAPSFVKGDGNGNLYVADTRSHAIHVFSTSGDFIRKFGSDTPDGLKKFGPNGIALTSDGRVIVTDTPNHRYFIFDQSGKILKTLGTHGEKPGEINFPGDVCLIGDTIICMVDIIGCRIQLFDLDGKFLSGFGEVGTGPGLFGRPGGVAWDGSKIWVSDAMHSVIQSFKIDGTPVNAFNDVSNKTLAGPTGITVVNNTIYIANSLDKQILVIKL